MDRKEEAVEKKISLLEAENKELDQELTKEQKKAAIAEAKKLYGRDWKKILFGAVKSLKVDRETLQSLHSMGVNTALKDYNDPRKWRE
jgi:predicted phage-related endonuclease